MPEGPEVAVLAEILNEYFQKKKFIVSAKFLKGKYFTNMPTEFRHFLGWQSSVTKFHIKSVSSKGKFIWFEIVYKDFRWFMMSTLGLTGYWTVINNKKKELVSNDNHLYKPKEHYTIFEMTFEDDTKLIFEDMRMFGTIIFTDRHAVLEKKLASLGPDLVKGVDYKTFKESILKHPKKNIVKLLMNEQKVLSGIGNYAIAEILYRAELSPHRLVKDLDTDDLKELYKQTIYVMKLFYTLQGGENDYYPEVKLKKKDTVEFLVYKRKKDDLDNVVKAEKINGTRTTYWVPSVQK